MGLNGVDEFLGGDTHVPWKLPDIEELVEAEDSGDAPFANMNHSGASARMHPVLSKLAMAAVLHLDEEHLCAIGGDPLRLHGHTMASEKCLECFDVAIRKQIL